MDSKPDQGGEDQTSKIGAEELSSLKEQITNLNKGIASIRDEAQSWKSKYEEISNDLNEFKDKIEFSSEDDEDAKLAPEDQKKLEEWARKKGFVTNEEFEEEKQKVQQDSLKLIESSAVSEFLEKHKEYDNDEQWSKIRLEFGQYKTPTTIEGYRKLLNKIHNELTGGTSKAREDGKAQARAEMLTKGRLSFGGGSQGGHNNDQDVESLQKKYPNLSREQIEERLSDIRSLYPKK